MTDKLEPVKLSDETPRHVINVPGDHVLRAVQENYTPDQAEMVLWSYHRVREMEWPDAAEFYDLDVDLLNRVWRGKAKDNDLEKLLKRVGALRERIGKNAPATYARTNAAKRMFEACDVARELSDAGEAGFVFIGADAGAGKTTVLRAWHEQNNHGRSIYHQLDRTGGVKHLVQDLAHHNGINLWISHNDMLRRVRRAFTSRPGYPSRILQVDDAHKLLEPPTLSLPKLEYLLGLVDTTRCIIILAAAMDKFGEFMALTAYNSKQFWRRCPYHVIIDEPADSDDIRALLAFLLPDMETDDGLMAFMRAINKHEFGGFGKIAPIVREAKRLAKKRGERFNLNFLKTVADEQLKDLAKLAGRVGTAISRASFAKHAHNLRQR